MLKTVYRSSCRDKHDCPRRDSNLDPLTPQSDALTTRPLRPAKLQNVLSPQRLSRRLCRRLLKHLSPSSRRRRALRKPSVAWPAALNDIRCFWRSTVLAAVPGPGPPPPPPPRPPPATSASWLRLSATRDAAAPSACSGDDDDVVAVSVSDGSSSWSDLVLRCHAASSSPSSSSSSFAPAIRHPYDRHTAC